MFAFQLTSDAREISAASGALAPSIQRVARFGRVRAVSTFPATVWPGSTVIRGLAAAEEQWEMVSTSAADIGLKVRWATLDKEWRQITDDVVCAGMLPVNLSGKRLRVNSGICLNRLNAGSITLRVVGTGATREVIPMDGALPRGAGGTRTAAFHVPRDFVFPVYSAMLQLHGASGLLASGNAKWAEFVFNNVSAAGWQFSLPLTVFSGANNPYLHSLPNMKPLVAFTEMTDFSVEITAASNPPVDVGAIFRGYLVHKRFLSTVSGDPLVSNP